MTSTPEDSDSDTLMTRARVLEELEKLRRGDGIDLVQVGTHGKSLMQLRAVKSSARSKGISLDLAALEYVRCAAQDRETLGNGFQRLLWVTMNFDGNPSTLSQRRTQLTGRLEMTSADRARERRAYESFAVHLVSRITSPCDTKDFGQRDKAWMDALLAASYEADAADFFKLGLAKLRRTYSDEESLEVARRLLELVPNGLAALGIGETSHPTHVRIAAGRLIGAAYQWALLRGALPIVNGRGPWFNETSMTFKVEPMSPEEHQLEQMIGLSGIWSEDTGSWAEVLKPGHVDALQTLGII